MVVYCVILSLDKEIKEASYVFQIGEVLIMQNDNIEIAPKMREPYRWLSNDNIAHFKTLEEAMKKSLEVLMKSGWVERFRVEKT